MGLVEARWDGTDRVLIWVGPGRGWVAAWLATLCIASAEAVIPLQHVALKALEPKDPAAPYSLCVTLAVQTAHVGTYPEVVVALHIRKLCKLLLRNGSVLVGLPHLYHNIGHRTSRWDGMGWGGMGCGGMGWDEVGWDGQAQYHILLTTYYLLLTSYY